MQPPQFGELANLRWYRAAKAVDFELQLFQFGVEQRHVVPYGALATHNGQRVGAD